MKRRLLSLAFAAFAVEALASDVISVAANRGAQFVATESSEPNGQLDLLVDGKPIWSAVPGYGSAAGAEISWSPYYSKAAVSIRGTKTTSQIHVLDVGEHKKELQIPDLVSAARALNGGRVGRAFLMTPIGWADEDHVLIRIYGNLVDWGGTDGWDGLNFSYVFLIDVSTQRVLSVTCTSRHNLNSKELMEQPRAADPPPQDGSR